MKNKIGFTLIETIVVIAIMSAMFAFLFVNFRGKDDIRFLDNKANTILSDLQRLQTMSLSGELVDGQSPKYYFFKFTNCATDGCTGYQLAAKMPDDSEFVISDVGLEKILINVIGAEGVQSGNIYVRFDAPRGTIQIFNGADSLDSLTAKAALSGILVPDDSRYIKISAISGRINISSTQ
ncbi:MAG: type II secretion system protein [Patescibacteria group bacterium]